ncbi:Cytochrome p450 [Mycena sanguinolenta]|uniref:Cytochrome p450 n=1 Tax=Mycena sanguinolenta TaxID=230812 RepID=A0A8H6YZG3_9AGAR|nr:Cytochrome p450 [Mycena sanguinolenta]
MVRSPNSRAYKALPNLRFNPPLNPHTRLPTVMLFSLLQCFVLLILSLLYLAIHSYTNRHRKPLPPGPKGLPLIGNLFDVPKSQEWLTYMEISRKYDSDIISLNLAGDTVIVLNSLRAVDDLLETKSGIYSDRVGFHWNLAFMRYGRRWKEHRKVFLQQFQPSQVLLHRPVELQAARLLLQRLLESPDKYERHLRHMAGMIILSTTYGINVEPEDDPYIAMSETAMQAMAGTGNRGAFLVDSLPFLKYVPEFLPGAGFKKQAREWFKVVDAMPNVPYDFVEKARADGTARSSIASRVLDEIEEGSSDDREEQKLVLRNILSTCYAGADTTVSSVGTFMLAMTIYPEIQKKAQAAVDDVVGRDRLPDFQDDIPYVDAIVREVLRWRPVVPLSIPHAVTEDDSYKGYHIPAGAIVVGNAWAILHDETTYGPRTDQFIPERWLTEEDAYARSEHILFCERGLTPSASTQGRDMAEWSIWISVASILAVYNISKRIDEEGIPIEPSGEYTSGLLCYPIPHECDILPRSEEARVMIQNAV